MNRISWIQTRLCVLVESATFLSRGPVTREYSITACNLASCCPGPHSRFPDQPDKMHALRIRMRCFCVTVLAGCFARHTHTYVLFKYVTREPDRLVVQVGHDHIPSVPWMRDLSLDALQHLDYRVEVLREQTFEGLAQLELELRAWQ